MSKAVAKTHCLEGEEEMSINRGLGGEKTLPMAVKNTGFLLDRLGEDCHPLQFLRELTTNSIEAILRTPNKVGTVIWDVDWVTYELQGVLKLSVVDDGVGMTGDEMVEYINQLSSSFTEQSLLGNYGVGGKIATATRNHAGVLYLSWKHHQGTLMHFWRDQETGTYGIKQFDGGGGEYPYFIAIDDDVKPDSIEDHGTKIVLHGNDLTQNTMSPPTPDTPSPSRWISKYLNTRYFRFPSGITVRAREGWEYERSDKDRNILRTIRGQGDYLDEHCEDKGVVKLTDAHAHWWILKEEPALTNNSGFIESAGHVAALYQDELYELATGRSGSARLQNFGVIFGYRQVVIYLEPRTPSGKRITTNTARTLLLINNDSLPWAEWAVEFRDKMPSEIKALVAQKAAASSVADHSKSIRERLKQILDLFKVSRYRPCVDGDVRIDDQTAHGGQPQRRDGAKSGVGSGHAGGEGGSTGGVYAIFQKEGGTPGKKIQAEPFPDVQWISVKDGTREVGMLEDRAARFLSDQNTLLINADFRVFTDMANKFLKDLGGNSALTEAIEDAVHNWFEQALVETVIGVQALRNAKEWSPEDIEAALTEEALTAAVMPRYHVHNSVKRELGSKFGRLDIALSASASQ